MELKDRVVLITGASMGLGEALAREYVRRGARVVLAARSADRLREVAGSLPQARTAAAPADVTDPRQALDLVDQAMQRFGKIDILVNNAGVGMYGEVSEVDLKDVQALFALNVFAPLRLIQLVLPQMKYRREGQIVNVSSIVGHVAMPAMGAYSASKFALRAFTDSLRLELKPFGIHVLGVYPGRVNTPFQKNAYRAGKFPRRLLGTAGGISPERAARAIVKGSENDKRDVVVPATLRLFAALRNASPRLVDRVLERMFESKGQ